MADGKITIDTSVDTNGVKDGMKKVSSTVKSESKKISDSSKVKIDIDTEKIESVLNNTEKSAKSKAASIAAVYRNAGYSSSEAFKKAWEHIERGTSDIQKGTNATKKWKSEADNTAHSFSSVKSAIKGAMAILVTAFSVRTLVNFGKQAIETASDLQEVQNVVDTAFGSMSYKMEEFANNSIKQFGISKLSAKQTGSTFMAMARGMGIAMDNASDMALSLTGLSADMASFYNISQDVASTALKSIFTGETETLKQFGIVMTEVNLQEFAYQQGINKKIQAMTQAEKVQLRYNYVMQQTALAQGDFAKTSDSYANQTRILKEQWNEFLGVLGTGLVKAITPVIKGLNTILSYLISIANTIAEIFGWKIESASSGTQQVADSTQDVADATQQVADANNDNAKAAKKADKATKGQLATFDKLNSIQKDSSDGGSGAGSGGSGSGVGGIGGIDASGKNKLELDTSDTIKGLEALKNILDTVKSVFETLKQKFLEGFKIGLGNDWKQSVANIKSDIQSIGSSLIDIFTGDGVVSAVSSYAEQVAKTLGMIVGSIASIGLTIAENLVGGISRYLDQNKEYIKTSLIALFDAKKGIAEKIGEISAAIAEIYSAFRSEDAKQLTADIIAIFSNSLLGINTVLAKLGNDIVGLIVTPITDNKDKLKNALESTIKPIETVFSTLSTSVTTTFTNINGMYDKHIKPMFSAITEGLSSMTGNITDVYSKYFAPVLQNIANKFKEVWGGNVQPLINNVIGLFGDVSDCIKDMWKNIVTPFTNWIISTIMPTLAPIFESIGNTVLTVFGNITGVIDGVVTALRGIITFVTGVFSADWDKCWTGIKTVFTGIFDSISSAASDVLNTIKGEFKIAIDGIKSIFSPLADWFKTNVWDKIKNVFSSVASFFNEKFSNAWDKIKNAFSNAKSFFKNVWTAISNVFLNVKTWFSNKFASAWTGIKNSFSLSAIKTFFKSVWNNIKGVFGSVSTWFKDKFSKAWQAVKDVFSKGGKVFDGIKDGILNGLKSIINGLINGINKVVSVPFKGLNKALSKLKNVSIAGAKPFDFLPTISVPKIPKLATGAVLPANKPFLSIVGDQKHGTNVEAPLDTIKQALVEALVQNGGTGHNGDIVVQIDGREVFRAVQNQAKNHYNRTGLPAF